MINLDEYKIDDNQLLNPAEVHMATKFLPKSNLGHDGTNEPEERMAKAFSELYLKKLPQLQPSSSGDVHLLLREFPVDSLGIADVVAISFSSGYPNKIRAFELKIDDWKKGISQVFRYKYYADVAILVLPKEKIKRASKFLDTFKDLRVGLWGFDEDRNSIIKVYTPRPQKGYSKRYRKVALSHLKKVAQIQPSE